MKVLISGGSRGLGLGLIHSFLKDGHQVVTFSRSGNAADESLTSSPKFKSYRGDVNDDVFLRALFQSEPDCDCLVNNAGVAFDGILATQPLESIDTLLQTNLRSAIVLSKLFVRGHLRSAKPGNIINVSSIIGVRGFAGLAVYSATKAGLLGLTRALARELGPKGYRVNAVLPGYFESEMSAALRPEQRQQIIRRTPLGRLASVDDVVPVVRFLASPDSGFVTGQCIVVDGGVTV